ncbi:MAG: aminoacyl-tRNA hydrolase [Candidatus Eisenbacteria bacterium]|nr:aminoacyl-tRNA hydrolase [Candidatus Eisenbacteria bacterium]
MKWILGLGNPGAEYEHSRHNLGFRVVERLRRLLKASPAGGGAVVRRWESRAEGVALLMPLTFMNLSGRALAQVRRSAVMEAADVLVVADDLHLPLGRTRIRGSGGAGGHNGIQSVIDELGTNEFARLRLGTGRPDDAGEFREFVLDAFEKDEEPAVAEMVERGAQASLAWAREGLRVAMNRFNN